MVYKPMTAVIACPCGKDFTHEFRSNRHGKATRFVGDDGKPITW
jgi:hypothetical protein